MNYLRKNKKKKKKFFIVCLSIVFLFYLAIPALAETIQELENQKAASQQVIDSAQYTINQQQANVDAIEQEIIVSNQKIEEIEIEISTLNSQISVLTDQITETQQKLDETIAEETRQNELMKNRLRVEYMYGNDGYLEAIFSGETTSQQLENSDVVKQILTKDKELLQQLAETKKVIEETKAQLESQKEELNSKKAQVEEKLEQQQSIKAQQQQLLNDNLAIITEAKEQIALEEASIAQANDRILEITIQAEREALANRIQEIAQKVDEAQEVESNITELTSQIVKTYEHNQDSRIKDYVSQIEGFSNKIKKSKENLEQISENTAEANTAAEAVEVSKTADTELVIIYENAADVKELRREITELDLKNNQQSVDDNAIYKTAKAEADKARDEAEERGGQVISAVGSWERDNISSTGWQWPLKNCFYVTSVFGYRIHPIFGTGRGHEGIDIGESTGVPIYACDGGKVILAGVNGGYGNCVIVQQYSGHQVYYGHQSKINVVAGQIIKKGDVIGYVGSTGWSTGPHLHLGVLSGSSFVDPLTFFPELN